jgi:cytochrome bd ubiquinol oxidase subunit II
MHLYDVPLIFVLMGLVLYTVLGGADFGAGMWQLMAGSGPAASRIRDHAHHSMAPVWEANHVWLIFVLTVMWTAYPVVFGSIGSTLSVPLFIAGIGIIFRGAAYALRSGTRTERETRRIDTLFAVSSVLTPFALGAAIGGVASLRVPAGNAAGHLFSSWLNPTSALCGALAVATAAYLAAVYLSADAARQDDRWLVEQFRRRALAAGVVAGGLALGGLAVMDSDAPLVYHGLIHGSGLAGLIVSIAAGVATLGLCWRGQFQLARYTAALAVAAIIAGWALGQYPKLLVNLTIHQAAAPHDTLVAVIISVLAGAVILFPSLALLFGLLLRGRFDPGGTGPEAPPPSPAHLISASRRGLLVRAAGATLLAGIGLLNVAEAGWAHAVGVICLIAFVVLGFGAVAPAQVAELSGEHE